jgi:hypothetical protein
MTTADPEPGPEHPDLAPREVPVGGTASHQTSGPSRILTERRYSVPTCSNY